MSIALSSKLDSHNSTHQSTGTSSHDTSTIQDDEQRTKRFLESGVFPVFSDMTRVKISPGLFSLQGFITCLQLITSSFFISCSKIVAQKTQLLNVLTAFSEAMVFTDIKSSALIWHIIGIALFIIYLFFILLSVYQFKKYHITSKWMLAITKIIVQFCLPITVPILISFFCRAVVDVFTAPTTESIVFALIYIPVCAISFAVYIITSDFSIYTPTIMRHFFAAWESKAMVSLVILTSLLEIAATVLDLFESWLPILSVILIIVLSVLFIKDQFDFIFMRPNASVFVSSVLTAVVISCILSIVSFFVPLIDYIRVFVPVGVFVISLIVYGIIMNKIFNSYAEKMSVDPEKPLMGENDRKAYFNSMVFRNYEHVKAVLHAGLVKFSPHVTDFSFQRYLLENYAFPPIIKSMAQVASFFPSELHFFTYLLTLIENSKNSTIVDMYFMYQLRRVHITRQSSASNDAVHKINGMKKRAQKAIAMARGFWLAVSNTTSNVSLDSIYKLRVATKEVDSAFADSIDHFPNSQELCANYAQFLMEGMADFRTAVSWKRKAAAAEQGKAIVVDHAFRSFVNAFPEYLTCHILDTHGVKIMNKKESFSSQSSVFSTSTNSSLDADYFQHNNSIIQSFIIDGQFRIAMQNLLKQNKLKSLECMEGFTFIFSICFIVVFIIIMVVIPMIASQSLSNIIENDNFAQATIAYASMCLGVGLASSYYREDDAAFTGRNAHYIGAQEIGKYGNLSLLEPLGLVRDPVWYTHHQSLTLLYKVTEVIKSTMNSGVRKETTDYYINGTAAMTVTDSSGNYVEQEMSVKAVLSGVINNAKYGLATTGYPWVEDKDLGTAATLSGTAAINGLTLSTYLRTLLTMLAEDGHNQVASQLNTANSMMIYIPSIMGVIFVAFAIGVSWTYFQDTKRISRVMLSISPDVIEESLQPIEVGSKSNNMASGASVNVITSDPVLFLLPIVTIVSIAACCLLIVGATSISSDLDQYDHIFTFYQESTLRHESMIHFINAVVCALKIDNWVEAKSIEYMKTDIEEVAFYHQTLMQTVTGFDDKIDDLQLKSECQDRDSVDIINFARCLSLDKRIDVFQMIMQAVNETFKDPDFNVNSPPMCKMIYLLDSCIHNDLLKIDEQLVQTAQSLTANMTSQATLFCVIGIVVVVILVYFLTQIVARVQSASDGVKQVLGLLPPSKIVKNKVVMDFIQGNVVLNDLTMTLLEMIISEAPIGVIRVNSMLNIDGINPMITKMTGYAQEQILQRPIMWLIPERVEKATIGTTTGTTAVSGENSRFVVDAPSMSLGGISSQFSLPASMSTSMSRSHVSAVHAGSGNDQNSVETFYTQLSGVVSGSGEPLVENLMVQCITEKGTVIEASASAIRIEEGNKIIGAYIMLADRTQEIENKNKAIASHKRSTMLLRGLLPAPAAANLARGESLVFASERATIIFIKIVGLNDLVSMMTPTKLMSVLLAFNDKVDEVQRRFPSVIRVKTNDELIMFVSGLFDMQDNPQTQVTQSVMFCAELFDAVAQTNESLTLDLKLCIGVSHGGPICGSVLDVTNPSFEVMGPVIGSAMKMVNEGVTGTVQVSESVKGLLDPAKFIITEGIQLVAWYTKKVSQVYNVKKNPNARGPNNADTPSGQLPAAKGEANA